MNSKSRIYNSKKNVLFSIITLLINTLTSFVSRTIFIKELGIEYLGLNGLFTEVIAMLSLAEMGVGMAIVYNLYEPLHNKDEKKISRLMNLYKNAYRMIAVIILICGFILCPFVHKIVTEVNFEIHYIRIIFVLFVIRTASSYLFSYKSSLLNADQKQYIVSLINSIVKTLITILTILILIATKNYVLYLLILIIQSIISNVLISIYVDKNYSYIDYRLKLEKEERSKIFDNIKNIFIKRVSGVVTDSTDNVLISTLVSTIQVGYYNNYVMIFTVVRTLRGQVTNAIAASIGDLYVNDEVQKSEVMLRNISYIYYCFACVVSLTLAGTINLIITIWLGEKYTLSTIVVNIVLFNIFLEICFDPLWQFLEVSGLFDRDMKVGLIGSSCNLIVSIIFGKWIGMSGIFLGTIVSRVIQIFLKSRIIYKYGFSLSQYNYVKMALKMIAYFCLGMWIICFATNSMRINNVFLDFIISLILSFVMGVCVSIIPFRGCNEYLYAKSFVIQNTVYRKK